ncbi:MAG: ABC transporter permease [Acidobacteriaceae bacterium]
MQGPLARFPRSLQQNTHMLARSQVVKRSWPFLLDLTVAACCLAAFFGVLQIARFWFSKAQPEFNISLSPSALPLYAFYSVVRIGLAYLLSLVFAVGYGYIAAYNKRAEAMMIASLDILQSIPVLSFLPGVMLAMVALIPTRQLGVELGAILLIFTGQVWNMAFSFYSSLKGLPTELQEVSSIYGFSAWQRFWQLELPHGAIGLIWNSMISVAGGWFFLMACEMFVLGDRDFRLPGLGSYLQTAAGANNIPAMVYGIATIIAIIVATDQLVWRPIIAWSDKFKVEQSASVDRVRSPILHLIQHSHTLRAIRRRTLQPLSEHIYRDLALRREHQRPQQPVHASAKNGPATWLRAIALIAVGGVVLWAACSALLKLRAISGSEFLFILEGAGATFLRVNLSLLLASAWTIPVGVAIGFNPRLARIVQPIVQIAAAFPAPILFPIIILALMALGGGLGIGSIVLMLLAAQWYILFNVIAGAMAIPTDLREVSNLFRFTRRQRWQTVILPGIFPYLITGLVTASGGAWNASIIAEYFHLKGQTLHTLGLGAQISAASDHGQFHVLLLATIVMALMVVTVNRLVWRPLYRVAETRYKLDA